MINLNSPNEMLTQCVFCQMMCLIEVQWFKAFTALPKTGIIRTMFFGRQT